MSLSVTDWPVAEQTRSSDAIPLPGSKQLPADVNRNISAKSLATGHASGVCSPIYSIFSQMVGLTVVPPIFSVMLTRHHDHLRASAALLPRHHDHLNASAVMMSGQHDHLHA